MRTISCAIGVLTLASCVSAQNAKPQISEGIGKQNLQTGYCPMTRQLETEPSQKFFFDGTLGGRGIRLFLDRGGSQVVGLFYYSDGDWNPTVLGGDWESGAVNLTDATETHAATGRLQGKLAPHQLIGTWTAVGSGNAVPVKLSEIRKPECGGSGPWKRFDDARRPISFSYPADWLLHVSDESITLSCPNPEEIADGGDVEIYQGQGFPHGPTPLVRCGSGWRYGSECSCQRKDELECQPAKVTRQKRATVLDVSEREWRIYCREGRYAAQGEGVDRIMLVRDAWLEIIAQSGSSGIIDRLAESVRLRDSANSK